MDHRHEVDELIELERVEVVKAEAMITNGEIIDAKTISGIACFLLTRR